MDNVENLVNEPTVEDNIINVTFGDQEETVEYEQPSEEVDYVEETAKLRKEKAELESKLAQYIPKQEEVTQAPTKPTLEQHAYDAEEYEKAYDAWHITKVKADEYTKKQQEAQQSQAAQWQKKVENYAETKKKLGVTDYAEAEAAIEKILSVTQQNIIVKTTSNPALLVYALAKNPNKAKELAAIVDPIDFTYELAKIESQMKTRNSPTPERMVKGKTTTASVDSTLARLRTEAEKNGDYTKVLQYRKTKKG